MRIPPRASSEPTEDRRISPVVAVSALPAALAALLVAGCGDSPPSSPASVTCGPDRPSSLMACVDEARFVADLRAVTGERPPGSAGWRAVQDRCATELARLGFTVERFDYGTGVDVIGVRAGSAPDGGQVVIGAHYDHVPGCAGADDNASGVAGVLELARVLAPAHLARALPHTLVVACWDEEERGLRGSAAHARRVRDAGVPVVMAWNLDMIAFTDPRPGSQQFPEGAELLFPDQHQWLLDNQRRGDFIGLAIDASGHGHAAALESYAARAGLKTLVLEVADALKLHALLEPLRRADHASFWAVDYPAATLSDSAELRSPYYHCAGGPDTIETLDIGFAVKVLRATAGAAAVSLGLEAE